jgi:mannose-6-phosphate isomerase-like protein (cupin superfamily)
VQPIRPIDWDRAQFNRPGGYRGQVLYSGESCHIIATLVPPGAEGPPTHVHTSDQLYFIVDGELEVELGTDTRTMRGGEGLLIPAGLPHHNRNTADRPEVHLEVIAPGVTPGLPLAVMVEGPAAEADRSGGRPYVLRGPEADERDRPFRLSWLLNRAAGADHAGIYVADMAPGARGPATHVHDFDQFYFVLSGRLEVQVALQHHVVGPNNLVVLPAGVPHSQGNASPDEPERHLAVLVPEPPAPSSADQPWDTVVDFTPSERQLH